MVVQFQLIMGNLQLQLISFLTLIIVNFLNNSAISNHQSFGTSFFIKITKKSVNLFTNLSFVNNSAYSIQNGRAGAISFEFDKKIFQIIEKFENCIFNNN